MNKKLMSFAFVFVFAIALTTAILVPYLSNTVEETVIVESPITIDEEIGLELTITHSGSDDFALVKITNHIERDITANVELTVDGSDFGYSTEGIAVAITDDINYCFKQEGNMDGVTDCEEDYMTWMENNVDWNDWYANEEYSEDAFFSELVVNTDKNSFTSLGYNGNLFTLPGLNFPAEETVYGVVYVTTNPALAEATYEFGMTIVPTQ